MFWPRMLIKSILLATAIPAMIFTIQTWIKKDIYQKDIESLDAIDVFESEKQEVRFSSSLRFMGVCNLIFGTGLICYLVMLSAYYLKDKGTVPGREFMFFVIVCLLGIIGLFHILHSIRILRTK